MAGQPHDSEHQPDRRDRLANPEKEHPLDDPRFERGHACLQACDGLLDVRVDIQRSVPPKPPDRLEAKTSVRPSPDRLGCCSAAAEFSGAPRFTGADHASWTLRRVDVHRSAPPRPPERVEKKKTSLPSVRSVAPWSVPVGSLSSGISIAGPRVAPSRVSGA